MTCEEIQFDLPLYSDDALDPQARVAIEDHLPSCPLCRTRLAEYREIRLGLRELGMPEIPLDLKQNLHRAIPRPKHTAEMFRLLDAKGRFGDRLSHWMMPLSAGAVGTAVLTALFLSVMFVRPGTGLFSPASTELAKLDPEAAELTSPVMIDTDDYLRIEIPETSPEINPAGALIALTRSIVRGQMSDEEVVVVADVFGNGIANIAEIVDPPDNEAAMRELRKAFETNPEEAPFLPSAISADSDAVRVVLKIQRVDVPN